MLGGRSKTRHGSDTILVGSGSNPDTLNNLPRPQPDGAGYLNRLLAMHEVMVGSRECLISYLPPFSPMRNSRFIRNYWNRYLVNTAIPLKLNRAIDPV